MDGRVFYKINRFLQNKSFQQGFPFLIFIVGGSFVLKEFTSIRYEYGLAKTFNPRDEVKKSGVFMKPPEDLTLEEQYKEFQKMNISEWANVRIPRPKDWND